MKGCWERCVVLIHEVPPLLVGKICLESCLCPQYKIARKVEIVPGERCHGMFPCLKSTSSTSTIQMCKYRLLVPAHAIPIVRSAKRVPATALTTMPFSRYVRNRRWHGKPTTKSPAKTGLSMRDNGSADLSPSANHWSNLRLRLRRWAGTMLKIADHLERFVRSF